MVTILEGQARKVIDAQLIAAGWVVQDRAEMNRTASLGVAAREFPLATEPCDYLLIVADKACGVVEAKAAGRCGQGEDLGRRGQALSALAGELICGYPTCAPTSASHCASAR